MRARSLLLVALFALGSVLPPCAALGGDAGTVAQAVRAAHRDGDAKALTAIAEDGATDHWRVAALLADEGAHDAARALARAMDPPEGREALFRYIDARREGKPDLVRDLDRLLAKSRRLEASSASGPRAESFEATARLADEIGWPRAQADVHCIAGSEARGRGDFEVALRHWRAWERATDGRRDVAARGLALLNLGALEAVAGEYESAMRHLLAASGFIPEEDRQTRGVELLANVARIQELRGRYRDALATLERAFALLSPTSPLRADLALQSAGVHYQVGDPHRALALVAEAHGAYDLARNRLGLAQCQGQRSAIYDGLGEFEEMRVAASDAESLLGALETPTRDERGSRIGALTNLGYALTRLERNEEALATQRRALALAIEFREPDLLASVRSNLALALVASGALDEAYALYVQVGTAGDDADAATHRMCGARGRAQVRLAQGRLAEAWTEARAALAQISVLTGGLAEEQGAEARARHADLFRLAARIASARKDPAAAWEAAERGRANQLLETLSGRDAIRRALMDPALREALDLARAEERQATALRRQAFESEGREELRTRNANLTAARVRLKDAVHRMQREAKRASILLDSEPLALEEFRKLLQPDEVFVQYQLLDDEAFAVVAEVSGVRIAPLGPATAVRAAVEGVDLTDASQPVRVDRLRALLIEPLGLPAAGKLLVSPDDILFRLPFAALSPDRPIAYVPSGGTYAILRRARSESGTGVLGVGDPVYEPSRRLVPLSETRAEVEAVADVTLLGPEATASRLAQAVKGRSRWRAVHLACHGVFEERDSILSGVELTDGRLAAADLFSTALPADLVVLSACDTGRGTYYPGEGLVGLTRAILFAGAPRVIASLWKVDDSATRALMGRFYELWNPKGGKPGLPAAEALRKAQEFVRDDPAHPTWKHPYYWAAWVLWGLPD